MRSSTSSRRRTTRAVSAANCGGRPPSRRPGCARGKLRAAEEARRAAALGPVPIRVHLPDGLMLQVSGGRCVSRPEAPICGVDASVQRATLPSKRTACWTRHCILALAAVALLAVALLLDEIMSCTLSTVAKQVLHHRHETGVLCSKANMSPTLL